MKRVTGLGGIFFRSDDPKKLSAWYEKHLGIQSNADGSGAMFEWRDAMNPEIKGMTVWSIFPRNTSYFGTGAQSAMINYRVENLGGLLELLKQEGVEIDPHREDYDYDVSPGSSTRMETAWSYGSPRKAVDRRFERLLFGSYTDRPS
jgi:hypothetical protein